MQQDKKLQVLVLVGGTSAEREVSLLSGQAVIKALIQRGHEVLAIDTACGKKLLDTKRVLLPQGIATLPPTDVESSAAATEIAMVMSLPETAAVNIVFLALHGGDGEDGHVQALLDMARAPYTGSGATASALAMNKHLAKKILSAEQIPTPDWVFLKKNRPQPDFNTLKRTLGIPFVVKPNEQGSTVGLTIVEEAEQLPEALTRAFQHGPGVLVEQYIPGRELTVAVLGDEPLPVVEIIPEHGIYDYECKYTSGKSNYICPADLKEEETKYLQALGYKAFEALGCTGYGRVDFRMNAKGEYFCLEVNTLPGMTSTSLVPKAAAAVGITFPDLIERICLLAIK